jgi:hypothetical protein
MGVSPPITSRPGSAGAFCWSKTSQNRRHQPGTRQRRQLAGAEGADLDVHGRLLWRCQGAFTIRPDAKCPTASTREPAPWYKDAVNSSSASLTEPYIDAVTGQLIISIGSAVKKPVRHWAWSAAT